MKIKSYVIVFSLINFITAFSQSNQITKKFFILGTLSDYNGRQKCRTNDDIVDYYYKYETSLLRYIYKIQKENYPDLEIDTINRLLKSKTFTEEINGNFNFEFNDGFCSDEEDGSGNFKDSSFVGKINIKIFKSKIEKLSYLTGAFVRNGEVNKNKYYIKNANSQGSFEIIKNLLQQIGCNKFETTITDGVPSFFIIVFTPTKELKNFLDDFMFLKNELIKQEMNLKKSQY